MQVDARVQRGTQKGTNMCVTLKKGVELASNFLRPAYCSKLCRIRVSKSDLMFSDPVLSPL